MKIAICDDQQSNLEHTAALVRQTGIQCDVSQFCDISVLLREIESGADFDAILMDIEWNGEQRGIDFASEIYLRSPEAKIVFVTGYPERYSQEIFLKTTNLTGFIAKPADISILTRNLEKIYAGIKARENHRLLLLRYGSDVTSVDPDDILYIESRAHTATVHTSDGGHLCYEKLNDLATRLPSHFVTTHKSFLVNMDKIRRIERERALLDNGMEVPVSKSRLHEVRERYFHFVGSRV